MSFKQGIKKDQNNTNLIEWIVWGLNKQIKKGDTNKIEEQIYYLERSKNTIDLKHHESYSISSLEKLAKNHSYERLEISQKINKLEIPYKLNYERTEKIAILGFGK